MSQILSSSSRTITLQNYKEMRETIAPNISKTISLDGSLHVDHFNVRGGWVLTYDVLTSDEYSNLRSLYDDQFTNEEFLTFTDDDLGISSQSVFLNMPSERSITWNKSAVIGLQIILEPETAS